MLDWLIVVPGSVAFGGWLSAAANAFLLLRHVAPPHTAFSLMFQGFRFFQSDTFLPTGHPIQRRFLKSVGVFGLGLIGTLLLAVLNAALAGR